jgi:hypothetical protein
MKGDLHPIRNWIRYGNSSRRTGFHPAEARSESEMRGINGLRTHFLKFTPARIMRMENTAGVVCNGEWCPLKLVP